MNNKTGLILILIILLGLIISGILYTLFGHQIITAMYEGRSIGFLNKIIEGQEKNSLEYYFEIVDYLIKRMSRFLFIGWFCLASWFFIRKDSIFIVSLLIVPIALYLYGISPSLVGADGDELLLQAYQGGIGHPGGFPVYLWIGKIFMLITNNSLNTLNLLSAIFSSLTVLILYFFMRKIGISIKAAVMAVLMYSFTPQVWRFAMRAEVYNVNAFFWVLILLLFYIWSQRHDIRILLMTGFIYGVSLGIYFANILMLIPILVFAVYEYKKEDKNAVKTALSVLLVIVVGAIGPLLYIYFRSKILPPIGTEYNPDNLRNFIFYIIGKGRCWTRLTLEFVINRLVSHCGLFIINFLGVGLILAFIGFLGELRKRRVFTLFLFLLFCFNFLSFTFDRGSDYYIKPTLSYLVVAIFIGIGIDRLFLEKQNKAKMLSMVLSLLIIFQIVFFPYKFHIYKGDNVFRGCRRVLNILPKNAILFTGWIRFPSFLCIQKILKERQDITIYEGTLKPRNYMMDNKIKHIISIAYIDENISNLNRPMYYLGLSTTLGLKKYLETNYELRKLEDNLFLILPLKNQKDREG